MRVLGAIVLLYGVVLQGPTMPVCREGTACSKPAAGIGLVFSRGAVVVARIRSRAGGRYSVRLRPGLYSVRETAPPPIGAGLRPATIRVPAKPRVHVDFMVDTGIR